MTVPHTMTLSDDVSHALLRYGIAKDSFAEFLASEFTEQSPPASLLELALAYACSQGSSAALELFATEYGPDFDAIAKRLRISPDAGSDARQRLWERLFVGGDTPPKILEFRGRGQLRHWFRVAATRFLLNQIRTRKRDRVVIDSRASELGTAAEHDPEFLLLRESHYSEFRLALQRAIEQLSPDKRNALRCHYLHGMSIDRMAEIFGTHRATAARRVVQAREELLRLTCEQLRSALGADTEEIRSVMRRAHDQSTMSVARLLAADS